MIHPSEDESSYSYLTNVAKIALKDDGWTVEKAPGHGRSNVWKITKNGEDFLVSIRTTTNRWIAYSSQNHGKGWKTLDDVDFVCVSAFRYDEHAEEPVGVSVHLIRASVVLDVFNQNYSARTAEGHTVTDNFGMWICIDKCEGNHAANVGSGFAKKKDQIAEYSLDKGDSDSQVEPVPSSTPHPQSSSLSVSDILDSARVEISKITGLPIEGISLELHMKA
jgi:hypothetical protein